MHLSSRSFTRALGRRSADPPLLSLEGHRAWNASWNGVLDDPSAAGAVNAMIGAASACAGREQAPRNA
jgi:hypothetical protein